MQCKYALGEGTDARVAVTRGISRPDYAQLAPSLSGSTDGASRTNPNALSAGNPELKPQHARNHDVLVEHFFPSVGVISAGAFYKQLTDVILARRFTYGGSVTPGPTRGRTSAPTATASRTGLATRTSTPTGSTTPRCC